MVKLFGSVLRSIMILRDNYVGSSLHFCTIDEYRQRRANPTLHIENRKKELEAKVMLLRALTMKSNTHLVLFLAIV